jgi:hypothetical protein
MGYFCKFIDFGGLICFVLQKNVVNHFYVSCETDKEIDKTKKNSSHHPLSVPEYGCVLTSPETFSQIRKKQSMYPEIIMHCWQSFSDVRVRELLRSPSPKVSDFENSSDSDSACLLVYAFLL